MDYKDVIELGFKRCEGSDQVFFNEHGFEYFIVYKKLTKSLNLDWDINTHVVTLYAAKKHGSIHKIRTYEELYDLSELIEFYKHGKH